MAHVNTGRANCLPVPCMQWSGTGLNMRLARVHDLENCFPPRSYSHEHCCGVPDAPDSYLSTLPALRTHSASFSSASLDGGGVAEAYNLESLLLITPIMGA